MKYNTINDLDARIENIIKRTVKAYYTDWKNIDRVAYMHYKGSARRIDKDLLLIVREYGTYLYTLEDLKKYDFSRTVCTYYGESVKYYRIDLDNLSINKIKFQEVERFIKALDRELQQQKKTA